MEISDIIKNGLKYPTSNVVNLIVLGIILAIIALINTYSSTHTEGYIGIIAAIVSCILIIIVEGYKLDIINHGIKGGDEITFPRLGNFVMGIKSIIVNIIYYIIPTIITFAVAAVVGTTAVMNGIDLSNFSGASGSVDIANSTASSLLPLLQDLAIPIAITVVIAVIVFLIFSIFAQIATARLAETGSIGEALSFGAINEKIGSIGWGKYIVYIIVVAIIAIIIAFISGVIIGILGLIPYVGTYIGIFIGSFILVPFLFLLDYYSLGLIYSEK